MARHRRRRKASATLDWRGRLAVAAALGVVLLSLWAIVAGRGNEPKASEPAVDGLHELIRRRCELSASRIICANSADRHALEIDLGAWAAAEQVALTIADDELKVGSRVFSFELDATPTPVAAPKPTPTATPRADARPRPTPRPTPRAARTPELLTHGKLAIILDDAGQNQNGIAPFLRLPREVSVAVLPHLPASSRWSKESAANGHEVLLHLPMQPEDSSWDPGRGAILVGMPDQAIGTALREALESVAEARGFNNHMGSKATADRSTMRSLMRAAASYRLFFIDSRTIGNSLAAGEAQRAGLAAASRQIFLDNEADADAILRRLDEAVTVALTEGQAIAIGHVYPVTLELLAERLPELDPRIDLVPPSELTR